MVKFGSLEAKSAGKLKTILVVTELVLGFAELRLDVMWKLGGLRLCLNAEEPDRGIWLAGDCDGWFRLVMYNWRPAGGSRGRRQ